MLENHERKADEKVYYGVCCWPAGLFGTALCAAVFVLVGGLWLLNSLNLVSASWNQALSTLLFIGVGIACLIGTLQSSRK